MNIEKIKVDTNQLQRDRKSLKTDLHQIKSEISNIYQDVQELDVMWDGSANDEFRKQFRNDYNIIQDILADMDKYIGKIDFAIGKYENCEKTIGDIINKIRI